MRVGTWNIWGIGPSLADRVQRITAELRRVEPHLMGFQEVVLDKDGRSFLDDYAESIGGSVTYSPGPDGFESSMRNAIVSALPIRSRAGALLPSDPKGPAGGSRYRSVVMVDAELPDADGHVRFYTTHLEHRFDRSDLRIEQLTELLHFLQDHHDDEDGGPTRLSPILTGDLNAIPESDEIRRLTGASTPLIATGSPRVFIDAWAVCGDRSGHTWSSSNPYLADAQWPNRRLDYVLVGYPMSKARPDSAESPKRIRSAALMGEGGGCSDHFGVFVDLN